jgi:PAS domain S-box-containing protein
MPGKLKARMCRFEEVHRSFLFECIHRPTNQGKSPNGGGTNTDIEASKRVGEAMPLREVDSPLIIESIPVPIGVEPLLGEVDSLNQPIFEHIAKPHYRSKAWGAFDTAHREYSSTGDNQRHLDYEGPTAEQVSHEDWTFAVHPDDLGNLTASWKRIKASKKPGEAEARLRRFDGEYRWFLFRFSPVHNESGHILKWYGITIDIDDRKHAEEELRRSEAFLAEAQRISLTGSFSWCLENDEIKFSAELYRIFEFDLDTPVTLDRIADRVHPDDGALLSEKRADARHVGGDHDYEMRLLMTDGSIKYVRVVSHRMRAKDGRLEYIGAIQDVTQRHISEETLGTLESELARLAKVNSLAALTASIAHEVSQPLSGVITNASTCVRMLAADPPNVEGALEIAKRTIRDGNRASDIVARLRALFGKKDAVTEWVNLNEAVGEVIALSQSTLKSSRVVLTKVLASDLPLVIGDRVQLQQVILNLLLNASEAMSGVDDHPRQAVIRTEKEGDSHVRLTLRDSGIGLGPEGMDKMFEAFYTTKGGGMGIGLSISRSIIERHHGRLWATPNDGPGATFSFSVPAVTEATQTKGNP